MILYTAVDAKLGTTDISEIRLGTGLVWTSEIAGEEGIWEFPDPSTNDQIVLTTTFAGTSSIHWGDGSSEELTSDTQVGHAYGYDANNFTNLTFTGSATSTAKINHSSAGLLTGNNVFNIYQANASGAANTDDAYGSYSDPAYIDSGGISFVVNPQAEKIEIEVIGRNDIYGVGYDTLGIDVNGSQIAFFQSTADVSYTTPSVNGTGKYIPALDGVNEVNQTVTHTFTANSPNGHTIQISGESGKIANNNVGYDVKITVTL
tara:strand:+ start:7956 stop:8738 length:783 start_codon:yes stop_codon:yes gene_type:complete